MLVHERLQQALAAHRSGNSALAAKLYDEVLAADPQQADAWHLRGALALTTGDLATAERCLLESIRLQPTQASFRNSLGSLRNKQQRFPEAITAFDDAIKLLPRYAEAYFNRGNAWLSFGNGPAAIASYRQAVTIRPDFADAWLQLALATATEGDHRATIPIYEQLLRLQPRHAVAWNNLSLAWQLAGDYEKALLCAERALAIESNYATAMLNCGVALDSLGRFEEAKHCFQRTIELDPQSANAHTNLAILRLRQEDWQNAWDDYEWRWRTKARVGMLSQYQCPQWQGESLAGKSIRLIWEQGLGDTLQFIRYGALLKRLGVYVILECQRELVPFLREQGLACLDAVVPAGDFSLPSDYFAPLQSLPRLLSRRVAEIPAAIPYLTYSPSRAALWKNRLSQLPGLKIGIAWQGNPAYEHDRRRSPPLRHFQKLAAAGNITFISLQKRDGLDQLAQLPADVPVVQFEHLDEESGAFSDTAAILPQLDLLIASDSAVAHLAGALGVRTWLALPIVADWRWFQTRDDSPWYPSFRLFRQTQDGDWEGVFERMTNALCELTGAKSEVPFTSTRPAKVTAADAENAAFELLQANDIPAAIQQFQRALAINPQLPETWNNLGAASKQVQDFTTAAAAFQQALTLAPDFAEAHTNWGQLLLLQGDWLRGWQEFEWRSKTRDHATIRNETCKLWQGEALAGKSLLLRSEQGLGDTLQFVRYATEFEKQGAKVIFECQPALVKLLRRCHGIHTLIARGESLPACDYYLPLLSAPQRLGTTPQSVPWSGAYLFADDSLSTTWRTKLANLPGRKIGLAWQGNRNYAGDRLRSPPLSAFLPLAEIPHTTFVSLQKGHGMEQLTYLAHRLPIVAFPTLDEQAGAFEDTAAILRSLDLFITSDSAVAHLAGGMGVPTWLVLPHTPDWRWLLDREDSPWYPTLRLFRQRTPGDWAGVFAEVAAALRG